MEILNDIPFSIDSKVLMDRLRIEPGSQDETDFNGLVETALEIGRPKAAYAEAFIDEREEESLVVGGIRFHSRALSRNLASVERVFPHVATCGEEMDRLCPVKGDFLQDYWWDNIKASLLGAAVSRVREHLKSVYRLGKTAVMSPGSADADVWPIEQQRPLFALLGDVRGEIGVELTESCLMLPNKSVSGLLFPTEKDFRSCEVCHREGCPNRGAPFNRDLYEKLHDSGTE